MPELTEDDDEASAAAQHQADVVAAEEAAADLAAVREEQAQLDLDRVRLERLLKLLTEETELRTRQQQVVEEMQLLVAKQSRVVQAARVSAAQLKSLLHEGLSDAEWAALGRFFVEHMRSTGAGGLRRYAPGQVPALHEGLPIDLLLLTHSSLPSSNVVEQCSSSVGAESCW